MNNVQKVCNLIDSLLLVERLELRDPQWLSGDRERRSKDKIHTLSYARTLIEKEAEKGEGTGPDLERIPLGVYYDNN